MHGKHLVIAIYVYLSSLCKEFIGSSQDFNEDLRSHKNYHLINDQTCGLVYHNRIVGGKNAHIGQYPWIAQIRLGLIGNDNSSLDLLCGGSILNSRYILSAAHCFHDPNSARYGVVLGEHTNSRDPDCELSVCAPSTQYRNIERVIVHSDYNDILHLNDIALVRLKSPIEFNDYVKPICLITGQALNFTNEYMEVAGWGGINGEKKFSDILQSLKLKIASESYCSSLYNEIMKHISLENHSNKPVICAGNAKDQDTCTGDSGGPAMKVLVRDGQPRYFLIGITSSGSPICADGEAAFFTDVYKYTRWILDNIQP